MGVNTLISFSKPFIWKAVKEPGIKYYFDDSTHLIANKKNSSNIARS